MSGYGVLTGFHAVEEAVRAAGNSAQGHSAAKNGMRLVFSKEGPRVRRILAMGKTLGIPCRQVPAAELDALTAGLPPELRDHRGLALVLENGTGVCASAPFAPALEAFADWARNQDSCLALMLDCVTDPHNVGAVLRSADQFGASAVLVPGSRSAADTAEPDGVIARSSSGASAWVPLIRTANLVRGVQRLKEAGFWVYGAEASGAPVCTTALPPKTLFILGSEGAGIARLLRETCDAFVSIPTSGRLDSLNVSVAAGILLYEFRRQMRAAEP